MKYRHTDRPGFLLGFATHRFFGTLNRVERRLNQMEKQEDQNERDLRVFRQVLDQFYAGRLDSGTIRILQSHGEL